MRFALLAVFLSIVSPSVMAQGVGCSNTGGPLTLEKVRSNAVGTQIWGCINRSIDLISSSTIFNSTYTSANIFKISVNQIWTSSITALTSGGIRITSATVFSGIPSIDLGASGSPELDFLQNGVARAYVYYDNTTGLITMNRAGSIKKGVHVDSNDQVLIGTSASAGAALSITGLGTSQTLEMDNVVRFGNTGGIFAISGIGQNSDFQLLPVNAVKIGAAVNITGSVTTSSITVGASGIRFSDGSNMTTAASGSAGGNNIWTGVNTHTSSTTFSHNADGGATPAVHAYGTTSAYIDMDAAGSVGVGAASTIYKRNGGIQFYSGLGPITGNNAYEIANKTTVLFNCQSSGNCGVGVSSATAGKFEVGGHYGASGSAPSIVSGCGTGARIFGNDTVGFIVLGTGPSSPCIFNWATAATTSYRKCGIAIAKDPGGAATIDFDVGTSSAQITLTGVSLSAGLQFEWAGCADFN